LSVQVLSAIALVMIAIAAWSGWLLEINHRKPQLLEKVGIVAIRPILQAHLDWLLMGAVLIGVDVIVPDRPGWITFLLGYGAIINPVLFLPLAFRGRGLKPLPWQILMFSSFGALSIGFTALAVHALI